MRINLHLGLAVALLNLLGCATTNTIHYTVQPGERLSADECAVPAPTKIPEQIVGVALSGGGSRASVFSAAVLEALWERGYIDLVTHISSVSGGSLAGSYFAANLPACGTLRSPAEQDVCWREFFTDYKLAMRSHFFKSMVGRQVSQFRFASNTRLAVSLQETIDAQFLHGMTFGDLADKNANMINEGLFPPVLLINTTSYDNGRRVVFSNMCLSENPPAMVNDIGGNPLDDPALRGLGIAPPNCDQPAPQAMPLSLAVTTSAAFPGFVGPITIEVPATCEGEGLEYWHLADGGLADNSGLDSIEEVILRQHRAKPRILKRALILSVASTLTEDESDLRQIENFWPSQHSGQGLLAYTGRSQGYHRLFWEKFKKDLAADGIVIENIEFPIMAANLDHWPASCPQAAGSAKQEPEEIRAEIAEAVANIPTLYSISDCNADLLELAAFDVVSSRLDPATMERLKELGFGTDNLTATE
jgi:predicted acylesterase/phospholipase RssA